MCENSGKQAKIQCTLHSIFAYKTSKKRRFCGGCVTRFGVPRTQSSSWCSCHLPHPARLHFAMPEGAPHRQHFFREKWNKSLFESFEWFFMIFKWNPIEKYSEGIGIPQLPCWPQLQCQKALWACRPDHRQTARKSLANSVRIACFGRYVAKTMWISFK